MSHPEKLKAEWQALAPEWIKESRDRLNPTREAVLDPPMLEACGEVTGLAVIDCGCGEGRFCRKLAERGAGRVIGLDLSEKMIAAARELPHPVIEYQVADVQAMPFLADASIDLAISYLNQCDLPDYAANTREVFRILKPGGRFLIANVHPMRSAIGGWQKDTAGNRLYVPVDHYFDESERHWANALGSPVTITNFHRTLQSTLDVFLQAGFRLERLLEPSISDEMLVRFPNMADERRVPNFIFYALHKEERSSGSLREV